MMKPTLPFLILLISILSCNKSKPKKVLSETEKRVENAKEELSDFSEKMVLLSTMKRIPYDSLNLILIDYYSITSYYTDSSDSLMFYSQKAIDEISEKYHISKERTASIIFSFKYEMLTKEEMVNEEMEKIGSEQEEPTE